MQNEGRNKYCGLHSLHLCFQKLFMILIATLTEKVESWKPPNVCSEDQVSDIFTEGLSATR